ncbi:MAG: P1 family peptidase [Chitinophagaceae bacterium]|nr:P1 family peptidase [Chitinophagaceae bacterium]
MLRFVLPCLLLLGVLDSAAQTSRPRELGITIGVMKPGLWNAITDVPGVRVGHLTLMEGKDIRTGVTAILPHNGNLFQQKVPAAVFTGNGFGKLAGSTQVTELGNLESPVILTNTLSVAAAMEGVIRWTLSQPGNEKVQSVNAVVGETNDGFLNDIRAMHVKAEHVVKAISTAAPGPVSEGSVGAGTGTVCFNFKGGIGSASRVLPASLGGYTVGVLVQTNFGGVLDINGVPVGKLLGKYAFSDQLKSSGADGSCMMVVATNAPLDSRNLERLAKRAFMGLARTGGIASNGSGDYVIAFSTDSLLRIPYNGSNTRTQTLLENDATTALFMAAIEATEEAIINSLFMATPVTGKDGRTVPVLPRETVLRLMKTYNQPVHD